MVELLLIEDVEDLGKRGDKVNVKNGYARNHLIPLRLAVHANADNLKMVEKRRVRWLAEEAKLIEELKELASHIAKLDLKIVARATDQGHLYGSVTAKDVIDAAASQGVQLQPRWVKLTNDIKEVGDIEVPVRLHEQVNVTIPVRVRMEGNEDWLPGQDEEPEPAPAAAEDAPSEEAAPEAAEGEGETPPAAG